jgi:hypothetical protein
MEIERELEEKIQRSREDFGGVERMESVWGGWTREVFFVIADEG